LNVINVVDKKYFTTQAQHFYSVIDRDTNNLEMNVNWYKSTDTKHVVK